MIEQTYSDMNEPELNESYYDDTEDITDSLINSNMADLNSPNVLLIYNSTIMDASRKFELSDYLLAGVYACLFIFGITGNLWSTVATSQRLLRKNMRQKNLFMYVMCLNIVDFLCLMCIPVIIHEMLNEFWQFGDFACKLLWSCESFDKFLSTFLLTAMSGNSYFAVCQPQKFEVWRKRHGSIYAAFISVAVCLVSMLPIYQYANVYIAGLNVTGLWPVENSPNHIEIVAIVSFQKCMFNPPENVQRLFTLYTFGIGYCLAVTLQSVFYALLISHVLVHKRRSRNSRLPLGKITKTIMLIQIFYMLCWTPYWAFIILVTFDYSELPSGLHYFIHMLPFINAAVNPVLYLQLNRAPNTTNNRRSRGTAGRSRNSTLWRTGTRRLASVTV